MRVYRTPGWIKRKPECVPVRFQGDSMVYATVVAKAIGISSRAVVYWARKNGLYLENGTHKRVYPLGLWQAWYESHPAEAAKIENWSARGRKGWKAREKQIGGMTEAIKLMRGAKHKEQPRRNENRIIEVLTAIIRVYRLVNTFRATLDTADAKWIDYLDLVSEASKAQWKKIVDACVDAEQMENR